MNLTAERIWLHHFHPCHHHHHLCDDSHHLHEQALSQFLAILVTLGFAIVGGVVTGVIMHQVKYFTIFYRITKVKVFMPFYDILVKLICTRWASLTLLLFLNCSTTRGTSTG